MLLLGCLLSYHRTVGNVLFFLRNEAIRYAGIASLKLFLWGTVGVEGLSRGPGLGYVPRKNLPLLVSSSISSNDNVPPDSLHMDDVTTTKQESYEWACRRCAVLLRLWLC